MLQSKTFHVVYKNLPAAFTIDWTDGFLLKPFAAPAYHFVYNFSQLKGSSDDGNATLRLQFVVGPPGPNEQIEDQVLRHIKSNLNTVDTYIVITVNYLQQYVFFQNLICPKLQNLLFYMHAFLTAKVASMDPTFLSRGRLS